MSETRDALGRTVSVGDTVGGAVFGRYPDTVWGTVEKITPTGQVRVRVQHGSGDLRPEPGDTVLLPRNRIFRPDLEIVADWIEQANNGTGGDVGDLMYDLEKNGYRLWPDED